MTANKKIILSNLETADIIPDSDTADYINDFFANIGSKLAANFDKPWHFDGLGNNNMLIDDIEVENEEVLKLCKDIDVNKSSCINNVSSRIIKDALIHLNVKFTFLINKSLSLGKFPETWKYDKVTPLFKGGKQDIVGNYRPVSLLPLPSKIIEKIVHNRLTRHLELNNFLDPNQGGFRKDHSTINTITKLTNDIFNGINNAQLTISCFIDMANSTAASIKKSHYFRSYLNPKKNKQ